MKIAFRGFRGFGMDSDFVEINDLTILTGKNGSGKSTFLKLLKLFSDLANGISNLSELVGKEIEIENVLYGGRENLLNRNIENKNNENFLPSIIIESYFDFYTDLHEVHFICSVFTTFRIKEINVYKKLSDNSLVEICKWGDDIVEGNIFNLYEIYKEKALEYNIVSEYLYEKSDNKIIKNYDNKYFTQDSIYDELIKHHLQYRVPFIHRDPSIGSESHIIKLSHKSELEHLEPFNVRNSITYEEYILDIPSESLEITTDEILQIFDQDIIDDFDNVLKYKINLSFESLAGNINKYLLNNFSLSSKDFKIPFGIVMGINNYLHKEDLWCEELNDFYLEYDLNLNDIVDIKLHLSHPLLKHSSQIFNNGIVSKLRLISYLYTQSNVNNFPLRSYDIYDKNNSYSFFIKEYMNKSQQEKEDINTYLKNSLQKLNIANDIEINYQSDRGFIYLIKSNQKYVLKDEGSGINNLVSLLLFFAINQVFFDDNSNEEDIYLEYTNDKVKILLIEEPESNLHPALQSKLADIIAEFVWSSFSKVIVETHSEYLIRKLQYLIATGKFYSDKTNLYYFDYDNLKPNSKISFFKININEQGHFDKELGTGFFDEADNIAIELYNINNTRNN